MTTLRPRRRLARSLAAGILLLGLAGPASAQEPGRAAADYAPPTADVWPTPAGVSAAAYVLVEGATGQVLAQHRGSDPRPVASTVKLLTALTAISAAPPDRVITVPAEAAAVPGAGTGLMPGDELTVRRLLELMIVRSGNDAAVALAVGTAGSVDAFVDRMRDRAAALELGRVVLETPTGLSDRNQLTADQLARLARAFLADPLLAEIAAMPAVEVPGTGPVASRNQLLATYPGTTGLKTGYTASSGWSVVASAEKAGRDVIAVVLGARSAAQRFVDAALLLDHAFERTHVTVVSSSRRLRLPGAWLTQRVAPVAVTAPTGTVAPRLDLPLPVALASDPETASIRLGPEIVLGTAAVEAAAPPPSPAASVGSALMRAAYRSMRAASRDGRWPQTG